MKYKYLNEVLLNWGNSEENIQDNNIIKSDDIKWQMYHLEFDEWVDTYCANPRYSAYNKETLKNTFEKYCKISSKDEFIESNKNSYTDLILLFEILEIKNIKGTEKFLSLIELLCNNIKDTIENNDQLSSESNFLNCNPAAIVSFVATYMFFNQPPPNFDKQSGQVAKPIFLHNISNLNTKYADFYKNINSIFPEYQNKWGFPDKAKTPKTARSWIFDWDRDVTRIDNKINIKGFDLR